MWEPDTLSVTGAFREEGAIVRRWSHTPTYRGRTGDQELTFRGQTLLRPRTQMVEAKDQEHNFSKLCRQIFSCF